MSSYYNKNAIENGLMRLDIFIRQDQFLLLSKLAADATCESGRTVRKNEILIAIIDSYVESLKRKK